MKKAIAPLCLVFLFLLGPAGCGNGEMRIPLTVLAGDGPNARHEFAVELQVTPAERSEGMMFRKELGANRGMLFLFPEPVEHPFWMRNTLIPLDIIFIGADKKIVNVVARAEPQTDTPREPEGPFQYTLEIEGGRAESLGIQAGDAVVFNVPAGTVVR